MNSKTYYVHANVIFLEFSKLQVSVLFVCFILLFNWCVSLIIYLSNNKESALGFTTEKILKHLSYLDVQMYVVEDVVCLKNSAQFIL